MPTPIRRVQLTIRGAVQGVGFRSLVYRLATERGLSGWVRNAPQGVLVETEGSPASLENFLQQVRDSKPRHSTITGFDASWAEPVGHRAFHIQSSEPAGKATAMILPDLATCDDCLREILDPGERRFGYPFTTCTQCGPRFSIIDGLPYDRINTTMRLFPLCPDCRAEYEDPADRRFHAQPIACPACGPHLEWWSDSGKRLQTHEAALEQAVEQLRNGAIVAAKGVGGFHLMVAAGQEESVRRLRHRKHRAAKPFAVMFPSVDAVREVCMLSPLEEELLTSAAAPIVLLKSRSGEAGGNHRDMAPSVAPGNPLLGVMLPSNPLHHLLMDALDMPLVATSGNRSDEPVCIDNDEAVGRLRGIADFLLVHDRPIRHHADDSIVRVFLGRELMIRRARGYAPLPIRLRRPMPPTLGLGGQLKNAIALAMGKDIHISQHIGNLDTPEALEAFGRAWEALMRNQDAPDSTTLVVDQHPDYSATQYACSTAQAVARVQHHVAHVWSCMLDNGREPPALGVAWDGTGHGTDGTVWGGEFLRITAAGYRRVASFRPFPLPGGEAAIREPRRAALGLLWAWDATRIDDRNDLAPAGAFTSNERKVIERMLESGLNCPMTTSAGRLLDAIAALAGIRQVNDFEGQAAMDLEFALPDRPGANRYTFGIVKGPHDSDAPDSPEWIIDWRPMLAELVHDIRKHAPQAVISEKAHNGMIQVILDIAGRAGESNVLLTGGCFQNRYLTERTVTRLQEASFNPGWHRQVPPNDGGLAVGQVGAIHSKPPNSG